MPYEERETMTKEETIMSDKSTVFDDIMEGLHEIEEYQKGNIELRTNTVSIPDEDLEIHQLLFHKVSGLSKFDKKKLVQYADELLQASSG